MSRVLRRAAVISVFTAMLLAPAAAFANDPQIQPPLPNAISQVTHSTFWHIVRLVLFSV